MPNSEKKVLDSTANLIDSLSKKMKEIDINSIKKLDSENVALGLIVCCTSTTSNKKMKNKKTGK